MDLPDDLRLALSSELAAIPQKNVAAAVAQLSARYRGASPPGNASFLRTPTDVLAYAAYRLPATFAAIHATLDEVRKRQPRWQPRTLLDAGTGPGTAMWAAYEIWPHLQQSTLLEREGSMISMGKQLSTHARSEALRQAQWRQLDLLSGWESAPHDLVLTAYVLGELPVVQQEQLLAKLWALTAGTLVIIEPGTPAGFSRILQARHRLLKAGANVLAPCPHMLACPMTGDDWCHFAQRITRTQLHRQVKRVDLPYEDEKFSYVAASRSQSLPISGRINRHPQIRGGHIHLELCTPDGLKSVTVTRKDRAAFRRARDLRWGDALVEDELN
jgi:ribosomal protein RSM22 (predicted rRNA methylase)